MGELSGKVRSTPTPKETLRTVKVRPSPAPWSLITTPWKTWIRERLPSTTFTWTLIMSPARKAGTSSRRLSATSWSITFGMVSPHGRHRPTAVRVLNTRWSGSSCRLIPLWQECGRADQGTILPERGHLRPIGSRQRQRSCRGSRILGIDDGDLPELPRELLGQRPRRLSCGIDVDVDQARERDHLGATRDRRTQPEAAGAHVCARHRNVQEVIEAGRLPEVDLGPNDRWVGTGGDQVVVQIADRPDELDHAHVDELQIATVEDITLGVGLVIADPVGARRWRDVHRADSARTHRSTVTRALGRSPFGGPAACGWRGISGAVCERHLAPIGGWSAGRAARCHSSRFRAGNQQ